ncbi:hypothetical protein HJC23_001727 [Cyclotella cryptica]|uniref:Transmembrane protein n=1 Tax=Cyclotella cryptica TaxID=29204 RepID=A0ABD3QPV5_9STRA
MKVLSIILITALCTASLSSNTGVHPFVSRDNRSKSNANYISSLLQKATPLRRLGDAYDGQVVFDLSQYSIKFEKCQTAKQYSNSNNNKNKWVDTVLSTKRFVIFRLCPNHSCSSCNADYGEYIIEMESYLEATIQHKEQEQEQYCYDCDACLAIQAAANGQDYDDDGTCNGVDTSTCYAKCQNIANMEANGYEDAALYTQCGKVYENQNTGVSYYAGATCSSSGSRIKISLFKDDQCSVLDSTIESIDQYIKNANGYNVKLSYHLLRQTFVDGDCVASCADENYGESNNNSSNGVSQMCQTLYEEAGKCESIHGFATGIGSSQDNYATQISNEEAVCEYISTIRAGHYNQTGEIVLIGTTYSSSLASTSDAQMFALTFFVVGSVGLAVYAVYLKRKISGKNSDLIKEDGVVL